MAKCAEPTDRHSQGYYEQTRRPLPSLILVAAMLFFFHLGSVFYGSYQDLRTPQYLGDFFIWLGAPAGFFPAIAVMGVLLVLCFAHRDKWDLHLPVFIGIIVESILWTIPLVAASLLTARIAASTGTMAHRLFVQKMLLAAGASVYEEFLFRLVLIGGLLLVLVDLMHLKKGPMTVLAIIVSAGLFSLCHFSFANGPYTFRWNEFIFLAIAGAGWGALFLFRGLGIAVGSHFAWNLFAMLAVQTQNP